MGERKGIQNLSKSIKLLEGQSTIMKAIIISGLIISASVLYLTFNVNYDGDYEGSFTDLITEHFTVTTLASDYGTLLLSINDVIPFSGSYIAISKNDEMSSVGIDDIVFADGDKFTFTFEL